MKKFLSLFGLLLPFAAFSQNGANEVLTAPSTTTPYILVDTLFTLDNYPATYTDVYIHFANPTVDDIKAVCCSIASGSAPSILAPIAGTRRFDFTFLSMIL